MEIKLHIIEQFLPSFNSAMAFKTLEAFNWLLEEIKCNRNRNNIWTCNIQIGIVSFLMIDIAIKIENIFSHHKLLKDNFCQEITILMNKLASNQNMT